MGKHDQKVNNKVYYSTWEELVKHLTGEQPFPEPTEERLFIEIDENE